MSKSSLATDLSCLCEIFVFFCYIWYTEQGTGRGSSPSRPLLAVPTAHPSTACVPITVLMYNGPLLCGFNGLTRKHCTALPRYTSNIPASVRCISRPLLHIATAGPIRYFSRPHQDKTIFRKSRPIHGLYGQYHWEVRHWASPTTDVQWLYFTARQTDRSQS